MGLGLFGSSGKEAIFTGCRKIEVKYGKIQEVLDDPRLSDEEKVAKAKRLLK